MVQWAGVAATFRTGTYIDLPLANPRLPRVYKDEVIPE